MGESGGLRGERGRGKEGGEEITSTQIYSFYLNKPFSTNTSYLSIDDREALSIPVDKPREDGGGGVGSFSNPAEIEGDANKLPHLPIILGSHFLQ